MSYARIEHAGGALSTTLASDITSGDTTLTLTAGSTWPTGAVGPFYLVIDPATSSEEKILATARSTNSLTGLTRGVDGTAAAAHTTGAVIKHVFTAVEADEANQTVNKTLGAVAAKGDTLVGSAANTLTKLAVGANSTVFQADSAQTTGTKWAALSSGSYAAGSVVAAAIGSGAVTLAKFGTGLRPVFVVADATALLALTAAAGDVAFQVDTGRYYSYRGANWGIVESRIHQAAVTGGPTSGTTEATVGTLNIAGIPATYQLECSAYWSPVFSIDQDTFTFRIKVDGVTKATQVIRAAGGNNCRIPMSIPTSTLTTIAVSTASTVTVTVQRTGGTGTADTDTAGLITARSLPL